MGQSLKRVCMPLFLGEKRYIPQLPLFHPLYVCCLRKARKNNGRANFFYYGISSGYVAARHGLALFRPDAAARRRKLGRRQRAGSLERGSGCQGLRPEFPLFLVSPDRLATAFVAGGFGSLSGGRRIRPRCRFRCLFIRSRAYTLTREGVVRFIIVWRGVGAGYEGNSDRRQRAGRDDGGDQSGPGRFCGDGV